jgi:chromosome partitioning protein
MRPFPGIKSRLAQEFTGYTGTPRSFLYRYRGDTPPEKHHHYTPAEIRAIRLDLTGQQEASRRVLPPCICTRMSKGGTGKTTITANVAACLAMMGYKVLLVDGDPQASLSLMFGVDWSKQAVTHAGELMHRVALKQPSRIAEAIVPLYAGGMLDLIPASIEMDNAESWIDRLNVGREKVFTRLMEAEREFFSQYDVVLIDSAPATSRLTIAFMVASPEMLTVVMPEGQSLGALDLLESNIQELNDNFPGQTYGVHLVINRFNQGKKPHQENLNTLAGRWGSIMSDTIVRDFVGFLREVDAENASHNGPVLENEPNSVGARDIIELTKGLVAHFGITIAGAAQEAA